MGLVGLACAVDLERGRTEEAAACEGARRNCGEIVYAIISLLIIELIPKAKSTGEIN
jgi:hypothetical protein